MLGIDLSMVEPYAYIPNDSHEAIYEKSTEHYSKFNGSSTKDYGLPRSHNE